LYILHAVPLNSILSNQRKSILLVLPLSFIAMDHPLFAILTFLEITFSHFAYESVRLRIREMAIGHVKFLFIFAELLKWVPVLRERRGGRMNFRIVIVTALFSAFSFECGEAVNRDQHVTSMVSSLLFSNAALLAMYSRNSTGEILFFFSTCSLRTAYNSVNSSYWAQLVFLAAVLVISIPFSIHFIRRNGGKESSSGS
jgi:hypothetical protein